MENGDDDEEAYYSQHPELTGSSGRSDPKRIHRRRLLASWLTKFVTRSDDDDSTHDGVAESHG